MCFFIHVSGFEDEMGGKQEEVEEGNKSTIAISRELGLEKEKFESSDSRDSSDEGEMETVMRPQLAPALSEKGRSDHEEQGN